MLYPVEKVSVLFDRPEYVLHFAFKPCTAVLVLNDELDVNVTVVTTVAFARTQYAGRSRTMRTVDGIVGEPSAGGVIAAARITFVGMWNVQFTVVPARYVLGNDAV